MNIGDERKEPVSGIVGRITEMFTSSDSKDRARLEWTNARGVVVSDYFYIVADELARTIPVDKPGIGTIEEATPASQ